MVNMSDSAKLHLGIAGALEDNEVLANWVCIAEIFDEDGDRDIWLESDDSSTMWERLGLLEYAVEILRERIRVQAHMFVEDMYTDVEDDDDDGNYAEV